MGYTEDLEKIEKTIKDTEARLKILGTNIQAIDLEFKKVSTLEKVLMENVRTLKSKKVIAVAKEYENAQGELKRVKDRLTILTNDKEHYSKVQKDALELLKDSQLLYAKTTENSENNVLKFRRKDGKK